MSKKEPPHTPRERLLFLFIHLQGHTVQVQLKDGTVYEGMFVTCNPAERDSSIVLKFARLKQSKVHGPTDKCAYQEILALNHNDVAMVTAIDLPLRVEQDHHATKGFFTDGDISAKGPVHAKEHDLQRWIPSGPEYNHALGDDGSHKSGDWDQFATNKLKFGVETTFDESKYTTALPKLTQEQIDRAMLTAREIERGDTHGHVHVMTERHADMENCDYPEDVLYSDVVRPGAEASSKASRGNAWDIRAKERDTQSAQQAPGTDPAVSPSIAPMGHDPTVHDDIQCSFQGLTTGKYIPPSKLREVMAAQKLAAERPEPINDDVVIADAASSPPRSQANPPPPALLPEPMLSPAQMQGKEPVPEAVTPPKGPPGTLPTSPGGRPLSPLSDAEWKCRKSHHTPTAGDLVESRAEQVPSQVVEEFLNFKNSQAAKSGVRTAVVERKDERKEITMNFLQFRSLMQKKLPDAKSPPGTPPSVPSSNPKPNGAAEEVPPIKDVETLASEFKQAAGAPAPKKTVEEISKKLNANAKSFIPSSFLLKNLTPTSTSTTTPANASIAAQQVVHAAQIYAKTHSQAPHPFPVTSSPLATSNMQIAMKGPMNEMFHNPQVHMPMGSPSLGAQIPMMGPSSHAMQQPDVDENNSGAPMIHPINGQGSHPSSGFEGPPFQQTIIQEAAKHGAAMFGNIWQLPLRMELAGCANNSTTTSSKMMIHQAMALSLRSKTRVEDDYYCAAVVFPAPHNKPLTVFNETELPPAPQHVPMYPTYPGGIEPNIDINAGLQANMNPDMMHLLSNSGNSLQNLMRTIPGINRPNNGLIPSHQLAAGPMGIPQGQSQNPGLMLPQPLAFHQGVSQPQQQQQQAPPHLHPAMNYAPTVYYNMNMVGGQQMLNQGGYNAAVQVVQPFPSNNNGHQGFQQHQRQGVNQFPLPVDPQSQMGIHPMQLRSQAGFILQQSAGGQGGQMVPGHTSQGMVMMPFAVQQDQQGIHQIPQQHLQHFQHAQRPVQQQVLQGPQHPHIPQYQHHNGDRTMENNSPRPGGDQYHASQQQQQQPHGSVPHHLQQQQQHSAPHQQQMQHPQHHGPPPHPVRRPQGGGGRGQGAPPIVSGIPGGMPNPPHVQPTGRPVQNRGIPAAIPATPSTPPTAPPSVLSGVNAPVVANTARSKK